MHKTRLLSVRGALIELMIIRCSSAGDAGRDTWNSYSWFSHLRKIHVQDCKLPSVIVMILFLELRCTSWLFECGHVRQELAIWIYKLVSEFYMLYYQLAKYTLYTYEFDSSLMLLSMLMYIGEKIDMNIYQKKQIWTTCNVYIRVKLFL